MIGVFVIETLAGGSESQRALVSLGANDAQRVTAGEFWRLFTANFLHIGLVHIAFNLYALYIVGTEVEMFYGPWRFLAIYLLTGLSGALASYAFTYGLSAGASTATNDEVKELQLARAAPFHRTVQVEGSEFKAEALIGGVATFVGVLEGKGVGVLVNSAGVGVRG